jgi:hypothetical protein
VAAGTDVVVTAGEGLTVIDTEADLVESVTAVAVTDAEVAPVITIGAA